MTPLPILAGVVGVSSFSFGGCNAHILVSRGMAAEKDCTAEETVPADVLCTAQVECGITPKVLAYGRSEEELRGTLEKALEKRLGMKID